MDNQLAKHCRKFCVTLIRQRNAATSSFLRAFAESLQQNLKDQDPRTIAAAQQTGSKNPVTKILQTPKQDQFFYAAMSEVVPLLVFATELVNQVPELKEKYGIDVPELYEALKPVLQQKLKDAGIPIQGAVALVVQEGGKLIYYVAASPFFWVYLAAGAAVLAQLRLEYLGHPVAGRRVGAVGITAAGDLAGFIFAPAFIPVFAGALMGFGAWSAVDKLRGITSELIRNYRARNYRAPNNCITVTLTIPMANVQA